MTIVQKITVFGVVIFCIMVKCGLTQNQQFRPNKMIVALQTNPKTFCVRWKGCFQTTHFPTLSDDVLTSVWGEAPLA